MIRLFTICLIVASLFTFCTSEKSKSQYIDVLRSNPEEGQRTIQTAVRLNPSEQIRYTLNLPDSGAYFIWVNAQSEGAQDALLDIALVGSEINTGTQIGPFNQDASWTNRRKFDTRALIYVNKPGENTIVLKNHTAAVQVNHLVLTTSAVHFADASGFQPIELGTKPDQNEFDIVVYGATPGGIMAAMQASRLGKSVIILEKSGHVGGHMINGVCTDEGMHVHDAARASLGEEFFSRIQNAHNHPQYVKYDKHHQTWEPHAAERLFVQMLNEENVAVRLDQRISEVHKNGTSINAVTLQSGSLVSGKVFIDASYEGDMMAKSGVTWVYGRESRDKYGESLAGIRYDGFELELKGTVFDDDGNLLFPLQGWVHDYEEGAADESVQTHSIEAITTHVPGNMRMFPKPATYDPANYQLFLRHINNFAVNYAKNGKKPYLNKRDLVWLGKVPNGKYIMNDRQRAIGPNGMSTGSKSLYFDYPKADYDEQQRIYRDEIEYFMGLMYFLQNDPEVPSEVRADFREMGLCYDEYVDNNNLPYAMYVRENKRVVGSHIFTQHDVEENITKEDAIALGSHKMDSHTVRHLAKDSTTYVDEGRYFTKQLKSPYQISLRTVTPKREECDNLLMSYCLSASHVAHSTLRTIVSNLAIGQSTGIIAAMAVEKQEPVQGLDIKELQENLVKNGVNLDLPPVE